jgi:hypothetical protein
MAIARKKRRQKIKILMITTPISSTISLWKSPEDKFLIDEEKKVDPAIIQKIEMRAIINLTKSQLQNLFAFFIVVYVLQRLSNYGYEYWNWTLWIDTPFLLGDLTLYGPDLSKINTFLSYFGINDYVKGPRKIPYRKADVIIPKEPEKPLVWEEIFHVLKRIKEGLWDYLCGK